MSMYKYSYKTMLVNFAGYRVLNNVSDSSYKKIVNTVGELAPSKIRPAYNIHVQMSQWQIQGKSK